jgi:hypothetical protein
MIEGNGLDIVGLLRGGLDVNGMIRKPVRNDAILEKHT